MIQCAKTIRGVLLLNENDSIRQHTYKKNVLIPKYVIICHLHIENRRSYTNKKNIKYLLIFQLDIHTSRGECSVCHFALDYTNAGWSEEGKSKGHKHYELGGDAIMSSLYY